MKNILFVVGSLRKGSFNHQMAEKAERILEGKATVTYLDYSNLPLMNQDLETPVLPEVQTARDAFGKAVQYGSSHQHITSQFLEQ